MPLFHRQDIDQHTRLAIWQIREEEDFFLASVPLQQEITHAHKRLQHLAGRYLLRYLFPDFPHELIRIAPTRRPYLAGEAFHFSISHCGDYAAAIVSTRHRVGVDVEVPAIQVLKVAHKFLDEKEREFTGQSLFYLTTCWSAKEAVFKWYGHGELDFKKHIRLQPFSLPPLNGTMGCLFTKETARQLTIHYQCRDELVLAWLLS